MNDKPDEEKVEGIRKLVIESIATHNEEFIVQLIYRLQEEYVEIAQLSTLGEYQSTWTHKELLNHLTYVA